MAEEPVITDLYVCKETGKKKGAGTKEEPLKFLWQVLGKIGDNTRVHVSEGRYMGQGKKGAMPKIVAHNISIIGGYSQDFSKRNPFEYLTIIGTDGEVQGPPTDTTIRIQDDKREPGDIVVDGICIDRGDYSVYYGEGPPGAGKKIEGYKDCTACGYGALNRKMAGSSPTIEIMANTSNITVRNCLLINNMWWGIYVKAGGAVLIENNLVFISQGRAIEALGAWGSPKFTIKNNTLVFGNSLKTTEGRAISANPSGTYSYVIENNVIAFNDGGGVTTKFGAGEGMEINGNLFYFNRRADFNEKAGQGTANANTFEDDLEFDAEDNVHELPKFLAALGDAAKDWFDRYSQNSFVDMIAGNYNTNDELMKAREVLGLKEYHLVGYDDTYASYPDLPSNRPKWNMSRYPNPMKIGELMDWKVAILPIIGADGNRGIQPFKE